MKVFTISALTLLGLLGMALMPLQAEANPTYPRPHEVNTRLNRQHNRIHQGVKSGALTRREAETLRLKDTRVRYQEQRDRLAHHGHLTSGEYKRINHELNRDSRTIYRDKHNAAVR